MQTKELGAFVQKPGCSELRADLVSTVRDLRFYLELLWAERIGWGPGTHYWPELIRPYRQLTLHKCRLEGIKKGVGTVVKHHQQARLNIPSTLYRVKRFPRTGVRYGILHTGDLLIDLPKGFEWEQGPYMS